MLYYDAALADELRGADLARCQFESVVAASGIDVEADDDSKVVRPVGDGALPGPCTGVRIIQPGEYAIPVGVAVLHA